MKTAYGQLTSGSWFIYDDKLWIKDNCGVAVEFSTGNVNIDLLGCDVVTFVKSVEVEYKV